ncbi:MAG: CPBP family intramembrane metalloprotease [Puniceicoccales bacterium]|jgi:membrane protease YdiL (CAAX protease family)|nr:CPBP family intramembrane metalloprotease [Puniceicoccales bacterium]
MARSREFILFKQKKGEYSHKELFYLLVLFFGSLIVAAILSGPICLILNSSDSVIAKRMVGRGICKIYGRIVLVTALIALPFFFSKCGIRKLEEIGCDFRNIKSILKWTCVGVLFSILLLGIKVIFGNTILVCNVDTLGVLSKRLPWFVLCAALIGIFEEILFRGAVLRAFYTAFNPTLAIVASAMFFAYAHIKVPSAANVGNESIGFLSGFRCVIPTLFGFLYNFKVFQFVKLTLFGIILSLITFKNKSLNQAIGFHAGTVLMLSIARVFT